MLIERWVKCLNPQNPLGVLGINSFLVQVTSSSDTHFVLGGLPVHVFVI